MRKPFCLLAFLFLVFPILSAQDIVIMDQQVCYAQFEDNKPYPTSSFTRFLMLFDNPGEEVQEVFFYTYAQVGSTNYTNLLTTKTVSVLEKRYALIEIDKKRTPIENSIEDSEYPINFLKSTHRYYYQSFNTVWHIQIPYETLEKTDYRPIRLIIVRELYNGDGTRLLDKKEFAYDLIPEQIKKKNNRI